VIEANLGKEQELLWG